MKLNKLVIACGMLFAASTGTQAFAVAPGPVQLLISGASALEVSTQKAIAEMCTGTGTTAVPSPVLADPALAIPAPPGGSAIPAGRTFFRSVSGGAGNAYRCTSKVGGNGPFAAAHIMDIRKRNAGGSSFGVVQVAATPTFPNGTPIGFTNPSSCTASGTIDFGGLRWNLMTNCADINLPPHAGVSDVEPELFGQTTGLAKTPIVSQIFGIPVNDKLYVKLQAAQAIVPPAGQTFNPLYAPNLTYAEVRKLFTGIYNDWTLVDSTITPQIATSSTFAKVCRRVPTSGTQATINALLLNNPCGNGSFAGSLLPATNATDDNGSNEGAAAGAFAPIAGTVGDVYTVVMNSGNGQVDACLTHADVNNELAIGLLGTERISGAVPSDDADDTSSTVVNDQWHYVKLNGFYPSVDNTIAGNYDLFAEATFNRRTSVVGYTADQLTLMTKLPILMGNPATIVSEGLLGLAAIPGGAYLPGVNYPTLKGSRNGNTCRPTT